MRSLENDERGTKRVQVHKPLNLPYTKKMLNTAYQKDFTKKIPVLQPVQNAEIDANEMFAKVRLKNNYSIKDLTNT